MKKILSLVLVTVLSFSLVGCGQASKNEKKNDNNKVIKVGASPTPHSDILKVAKPLVEKEGYELDIVVFQDYIIPNTALNEKELDANFFQHIPFLEQVKNEKKYDLDYTAKIHIEPLGLYSKKIKGINEIKEGVRIAVPKDPTNCSRALRLLEKNGLIKLKSGESVTSKDIVENPKNLKIEELDSQQLPRVLDEVEGAVINTNYALEADLNPLKDALVLEDKDSPYANILVVRSEEKESDKIKVLTKALTSPEVKKYIEEKYEGTKIPTF